MGQCVGAEDGARAAHVVPELGQRGARAVAPAGVEAADQHRRIQRTGAGAGDGGEAQTVGLEQAVEHAPGEGAVRAAALQREVEWAGLDGTHRGGSLSAVAVAGTIAGMRTVKRAPGPNAAPAASLEPGR